MLIRLNLKIQKNISVIYKKRSFFTVLGLCCWGRIKNIRISHLHLINKRSHYKISGFKDARQ